MSKLQDITHSVFQGVRQGILDLLTTNRETQVQVEFQHPQGFCSRKLVNAVFHAKQKQLKD